MDMINESIFKAYDIRGLYGTELDTGLALQIGRAFARVIAKLEGKPTSELKLGLGRDMRLTAPEMAAAYAEGMLQEDATVVDAGLVGTEMLYYLVGSRELDGGLMCTASHNPKAYTGAKLVKRGAVALSGDAGIGDVKATILAGLGEPTGAGTREHVEIYNEFHAAALQFIDADAIKPLRVVVDGGNGMAGPMVGPLLDKLGLQLEKAYWTPDGSFPDHEPNPLLPENREFIISEVCVWAPTSESRGTATRTAASSSMTRARSWTATSSRRCWPTRCCASIRAPRSSTTCAPAARCPTRSQRPAAPL
ncbi:MAG: hypothetical protein ACLP22_04000 [Solirubrobacteraceae bacterium]